MPQNTDVLTGAKARQKILKGVNAVYETVRLTLGPEGKNALLPRSYNRGPRLTNDGVTVGELAKMLPNEHERLAAEAFIEGAKKTNELVGDGTTTTTQIAGHLINKIFNTLSDQDTPTITIAGQKTSKIGVRALRKDMKDAKDLVLAKVKEMAKPIKTLADLEKVAMVSIGKEDEATSKIIAKTVWDIARDAEGGFVDNFIDVTEGYKSEIEVEVIRGMRFPSKLAHRAFMNKPERFEMEVSDVPIIITNYKLDDAMQVVKLIESLKLPKAAIFAPDFSEAVIKSLMLSATKAGIFIYPIKCPALRSEQLEDLAVYTGATFIDKEAGRKLDNITTLDLGFAEKIVVKDTENKDDAILIGGKGEKIKRGQGNLVTERQAVLKAQIKESRNELSRMQLERRIANLSAAVGVIRVGATTSAEGLYLKLKIEDGVFACKAALEEGYVQGGGLCLKKIAEELPESILTESLKSPYEQIQKNAGGALEIGKDVIDPAKVVRLEVEHGVMIAAQLITTDILIPELREKSPGEGYSEIADAITLFVNLEARHRGMIKENEDYAEQERNKAFDMAVMDANKG